MKKIIFISILIGVLSSCTHTDDTVSPSVRISIGNLYRLENGLMYEAWLVVGADQVSLGKFNVPDNANGIDRDFNTTTDNLNKASGIFVSIEPGGDNNSIPSNQRFLSGNFAVNDSAFLNLDTTFPAVSNASGKFILASPTDSIATNDTSGVWFVNNGAAGLVLPNLTTDPNWTYQAWATRDSTLLLNAGTFKNPAGPNSTPCVYCATINPTPPFPGQDFLVGTVNNVTLPVSLAPGQVTVSLEPVPDQDPANPFLLILGAAIPVNGKSGSANPYTLTNLIQITSAFRYAVKQP